MRSVVCLGAVLGLLGAADAGRSAPDGLSPGRAAEIVRRGVAHAGGWAAWESKKTVQFRKTTRRFRPDGSIEKVRVETHRYQLHPSFAARIEWDEDGKRIVLINDGRDAVKLIDGNPAVEQSDVNQARNSTFGSHYVFCMPFKLADPGAHHVVADPVIVGGRRVDGVRVTYDRGAGDAGGLHTWTYYFDAQSGGLVANLLNYEPGKYDFTEYLDERVINGLRLPTRRDGYAADARGKTGPRLSEIEYEDIRFDVALDEALFRGVRPGGT
ncbi:MAG: hypothetical protein ABI968_05625 [Acidobacteriota bacterium]